MEKVVRDDKLVTVESKERPRERTSAGGAGVAGDRVAW